jgi:hypothetical protein
MMNIRLDWAKLRETYEKLSERPTLTDDSNIVFIMIMSDKKAKKSIIKFKDFMKFLWALSENTEFNVLNLVVQDEEGRILYRHKTLTAGNESIPIGGNSNVITHWNTLTQDEKDTYITLIEAQIQGYDR